MIYILNHNVSIFSLGTTISSTYKTKNHLIIDEIYDEEFKNIEIFSKAGEIIIKNSSDSSSRIIVYGNKEFIEIKKEDSSLNIVNTEKPISFFGLGFNTKVAYIEVYLPIDYANTLHVISDYGNIKIENFTDAFIDVESDAGNIYVENAKEANLTNNCGNIEVENVQNIKAENNLGNIIIDTVTNSLDISNDCGNIEINTLTLFENSSIESNLGNIEIGNTNEIYIIEDVSLGNASIKNNYPSSSITLTIQNNCGNVKVKN